MIAYTKTPNRKKNSDDSSDKSGSTLNSDNMIRYTHQRKKIFPNLSILKKLYLLCTIRLIRNKMHIIERPPSDNKGPVIIKNGSEYNIYS